MTLGTGTHGSPGATSPQSTPPSAPKPTVTTGPLPKAPGAPSTPAAPTPAPSTAAGLALWPAKGTAYTDVLESVPLTSGRAIAVARARAAQAAGLPRAGVLVSADYTSLHPGYFVVFSGVFSTPAAASAALAAAHTRGFPDAYVARVTHP